MWSLADELVDLDKLYTSDIYAILQTYGVEACRTAIINEMAAVFGVYGIKVDYRHRTVIADYMVSSPSSPSLPLSPFPSCPFHLPFIPTSQKISILHPTLCPRTS
jgi:hypothetical protein